MSDPQPDAAEVLLQPHAAAMPELDATTFADLDPSAVLAALAVALGGLGR